MDGINAISLKAVTGAVTGQRVVYGRPRKTHTMQITATGIPTAVKVALMLSLDGTNFFQAALFDTDAGDVLGDMKTAANVLGDVARLDLITLTGGTAPAVTGHIASTD